MSAKQKLDGVAALRAVLLRLRSIEQDGYRDYSVDGKWDRNGIGLGSASTMELEALFELAGIVPDPVVPLGDCDNCIHAHHNGDDAGWSEPCCSCSSPRMSNFVSVDTLRSSTLRITDTQYQLLKNARRERRDGERQWWADGLIDRPHRVPLSEAWHAQLKVLRDADQYLQSRGLLRDSSLGGRRTTMKGKLAMERHESIGRSA